MRPACEHIRLQGLGAEKQLTALQKMGYTLRDIRRSDVRTVEFGYEKKHAEAIRAYLLQRGFTCTLLPPRGTAKDLERFRRHYPLTVLSLCMLLCLSIAMQFIWRIDIRGAGAYIGEVRAFLQEENIHPGRSMESIQLKEISEKLTYRLPRVAWVRASFKGLTLSIDVTQGVPMPDIESAGGNGHLLAAQDGVIESIAVYAGTPAVRAGDTVQAGDILIYGHERGSGETLTSVRARGEVIARTYVTESAAISAASYQSHRTGNCAKQIYFQFPFFSFSPSPAPDYLISEYESTFCPLGSAWLPVYIERRTVYETYLENTPPDTAALQAEAARLAMQKLLLSCAKNDEIIDKWLDYSMIEGGTILATATAEVRADIGLFSPETPD